MTREGVGTGAADRKRALRVSGPSGDPQFHTTVSDSAHESGDPVAAGADFRIVERKPAFSGRLVRVEELVVRAPSGEDVVRESVLHPGAVTVVPLLADRTVVLCKQYRAPIDDYLVEVPAGKLKPGESPEECARRELVEETGLEAGELVHLATFFTSPGFTDEVMHAFVAVDLRSAPGGRTGPHGVEETRMELVRIPLGEWMRFVEDGTVRDAKSIVALALASLRLGIGG